MTIGKLINDQLQQDKRIKYAGIYQPSYLEQFIKIKIELDDMYDINEIRKILETCSNKLITIFSELKKMNNNEMKKFI